ncbi:MAG: TIGR04255 family protein, partial [Verrucomicrobiota bacterium]
MEYVLKRQSTVPPRPKHLPDFDNPPVVETVLSVQFEPLSSIQTAHLGLLWDEYRGTFPKSEDRPPLDPVVEQFPESPVARVGLKFQALENFPAPRIW